MDFHRPMTDKLENRGRRWIMADQADNKGDRMDERTMRSSGVGGGSGTISGTRGESGAETRSAGGVSRKTLRGFAAKGGRAAHQKGTAHEFTSEEARIAGRKGGEASRGGRRSSEAGNNNN